MRSTPGSYPARYRRAGPPNHHAKKCPVAGRPIPGAGASECYTVSRSTPRDVFLPENLLEALLEYVDFDEPPLDLMEIYLLRADAMVSAISTGAIDKPGTLADAAQAEIQTAQAVLDAWRRYEQRAQP